MSLRPALHVVVSCDLGPLLGVGHLMRCLALAEELQRQGDVVEFWVDAADVPLAQEHLARRGLTWRQPSAEGLVADLHAAVAVGRAPDAVVIDSYRTPPEVYRGVQEVGPVVVAIVDEDGAGRSADLYVEQNLGAENPSWQVPEGAVHLGGLRYALMRRDLVAHRPVAPVRECESDPLRVFAFFGGTDAFGVAPVVVRAFVAAEVPADLRVVVAREDLRAEIAQIEPAPGQRVETITPTSHLAEEVAAHDVVLAASGTTLWEVMCLGAAAGFVCVVDNQRAGYAQVVGAGLGEGLGVLEEIQDDMAQTAAAIARLLGDPARRAGFRRAAWEMVDGEGATRVVDALRGLTFGGSQSGNNAGCGI